MHPLTQDLTKLTDEELNQKYNELQKKMTVSYRMGNGDLIAQISMVMEDFQREIQARNQKLMDQSNEQAAKYANKIDITRN